MCDFEDDFMDDFIDEDFGDEAEFDEEMQDGTDGLDDADMGTSETPTKDQDTEPDWLNPFVVGGAIGFGYEEGLSNRKTKRRWKPRK